jgi:hypothetical protein
MPGALTESDSVLAGLLIAGIFILGLALMIVVGAAVLVLDAVRRLRRDAGRAEPDDGCGWCRKPGWRLDTGISPRHCTCTEPCKAAWCRHERVRTP